MKEELIGGLKNALERGYTLDSAVQSFINAGYNPIEVNDAARYLSQGASFIIHPQNSLVAFPVPTTLKNPQLPPLPLLNKTNSSSKKSFMWLAIIIFLLVFVGALILLIVFQDKLTGIFG